MEVVRKGKTYLIKFEHLCDFNSFVHYLSDIINDKAEVSDYQNIETGEITIPLI